MTCYSLNGYLNKGHIYWMCLQWTNINHPFTSKMIIPDTTSRCVYTKSSVLCKLCEFLFIYWIACSCWIPNIAAKTEMSDLIDIINHDHLSQNFTPIQVHASQIDQMALHVVVIVVAADVVSWGGVGGVYWPPSYLVPKILSLGPIENV